MKSQVWMKTALFCVLPVLAAGCSNYGTATGGPTPADNKVAVSHREEESELAIQRFQDRDPSMKRFFDGAYGYAVFPGVGKGAIGIGGAHGEGLVYEQGNDIGSATLSQATIGLQLGGQVYSEIVFFQNKTMFDQFKHGQVAFDAQASAVAASDGAAADSDYEQGVAIFTLPRTGLMFEAAVGGQKFSFRPRGTDENAAKRSASAQSEQPLWTDLP